MVGSVISCSRNCAGYGKAVMGGKETQGTLPSEQGEENWSEYQYDQSAKIREKENKKETTNENNQSM